MPSRFVFVIWVTLLVSIASAQDTGSERRIERLDPALDALIDSEAQIEVLARGFKWSEGPLWLSSENCVVFSDVPANTIYRWDAANGKSVWLTPSGYTQKEQRGGESGSNGLTLDAEGRLLLCQHGDRRVARMTSPLGEPASQFDTIADRFENKRFNSPNDLAVHSSGSIFFTDPPYGLKKGIDDPGKEIDYQGVFRVDPDGVVTLLTDELSRPNGIAFSPDEKWLYVAVSDPANPVVMRYAVTDAKELSDATVLFDASPLVKMRRGLPDGIKVDKDGNLFATGPGGVLILTAEGKHLGTILTGQKTANCTFGDDGSSLYMTAHSYLMRVQLKTSGW